MDEAWLGDPKDSLYVPSSAEESGEETGVLVTPSPHQRRLRSRGLFDDEDG